MSSDRQSRPSLDAITLTRWITSAGLTNLLVS